MQFSRCFGCMEETEGYPCPHCGFDPPQAEAPSYALPWGTILNGHYVVGKMLGQGGFGITYLGFDLLLEQKVAIKEYFPMNTGMVSRANSTTVVWSSAMMKKTGTQKGFDSFLKEARKMAKLGGIPGVVGVKSVFIQNETAYIVMDFIEGETLLTKLEREGPMQYDTCVSLLTPIIRALAEVHQNGIIHRDISPDNIMVQKDGKLILLDMGAAKDLKIQDDSGHVQSSQLVAKHGFSPFEQYGRTEEIGPWTDVYAMAATIYYCCTGKLPPSAVDRVVKDSLSCQPPLTQAQFHALASCMAVSASKRPQDMNVMLGILEKPLNSSSQGHVSWRPPEFRLPKLPKWLLPALAGIAVLCVVLTIGGGKKTDRPAVSGGGTTSRAVTAETAPKETIPAKVNVMATDLKNIDYSERENQPFWGQDQYKRGNVKTVTFQSTLDGVPDDAWDVSEAGDRSVLAWMDGSSLHVAADGKIAPNSEASHMFAYFENLKKIDFGDCLDTTKVTDMSSMFYDCSSLTSLNLSGFDTANVTNMDNMFGGCSSLSSLDVSNFDTSNVTDMDDMFSGCSGLTSLDLSGFDTSNVTDMGFMFSLCRSLTSLDVSSFNTANVTDMRLMFFACSSLSSLDFFGFDTANVTNMNKMFGGCSGLTSLDLSGFDTSNVTDMNEMFSGCSSLSSLDLSAFDTANVTKMYSMFSDCSSLSSLDLSGFDTSNVTYIMGSMFYKCTSLTDLKCSDEKILAEYKKWCS